MRSSVVILLVLLLAAPAAAQEYPFIDWSTRGVPRDAVTAITQDHRGYLWVGTRSSGLLRLDGREVFVFPAADFPPSQPVTAIVTDGMGTLFVGHESGVTAVRLHPFADDAVDEEAGRLLRGIHGSVRRLSMATPRVVEVVTTSGCWEVNFRDSSVTRTDIPPPPYAYLEDILSDYELRDIARDCIGRVWLATDRGLLLKDDGGSHLFDTSGGSPEDDLRCVYVDREMNVWCGSDRGLFMYTPGRFTQYTAGRSLPAKAENVHCLLETEDRAIWMGTAGAGLLRLQNGPLLQLGTADGLPSDTVTALLDLPSGEILIGTSRGAAIYDGTLIIPAPPGMDTAGTAITALLQASDRSYWIGTETGVLRWKGERRTVFHRRDGLPSDHVLTLIEDRYGFLWIGTTAGVVRIDVGGTGSFQRTTELDGVPVRALYRDRKDRIWMGTAGAGVAVRSEGAFMRLDRGKGLASDFIGAIGEDNFGSLYFGSSRGVSVLPKETMQYLIPVDSVGHAGKHVPPARVPFLEDMAMFTLTRESGLAAEDMTGGAILRDRNGFLWFAGRRGLTRYVPSQPARIGRWRPPICRDLREPMLPLRFDIILRELYVNDTATAVRGSIDLGSGAHVLRAQLALPSFRNPEQFRFLYKLQGLEDAWHVSRGGSVVYSNLPPGTYTLITQAGIGEGVWTRRQELLTVVVGTPLHRTVWFWFALLLLAGFIGFMLQKHTHARQIARIRI